MAVEGRLPARARVPRSSRLSSAKGVPSHLACSLWVAGHEMDMVFFRTLPLSGDSFPCSAPSVSSLVVYMDCPLTHLSSSWASKGRLLSSQYWLRKSGPRSCSAGSAFTACCCSCSMGARASGAAEVCQEP